MSGVGGLDGPVCRTSAGVPMSLFSSASPVGGGGLDGRSARRRPGALLRPWAHACPGARCALGQARVEPRVCRSAVQPGQNLVDPGQQDRPGEGLGQKGHVRLQHPVGGDEVCGVARGKEHRAHPTAPQ